MDSLVLSSLIGGLLCALLVSRGTMRLARARNWSDWPWMVGGWTAGAIIGSFVTASMLTTIYCQPGPTSTTGAAANKSCEALQASAFPSLGFGVSKVEFQRELRRVAEEVRLELDKVRKGESNVAPERQLEFILDELTNLDKLLANGPLPSRNERVLAAAWYVLDSWPYDHPLALHIMDLQSMYQKVR